MYDLNLNNEESEYLELILDELDGVISEENAIRLKEWRLLSNENNSFYLDIVSVEGNLDLLQVYKKLDPEKSLEALHKKIENNSINKTGKIYLRHWLSIAATLLVITAVAFYFIRKNDIVSLQTSVASASNFTLPDGTKLYLNANSEANYSKSTFSKERKLELLKGEVFLNVVHDPARPFSIEYKSLVVTDIGTSFNVKTGQNQIAVLVNSGQVKLTFKNAAAEATLNAGEAGYLNLVDKTIRKELIQDPNYKAYADHNINFNNTPLPQVVKTLISVYHKQIKIGSEDIKPRKFTGQFRNQKLQDVLLVLAESLKINIITKDGVILLLTKS